MKCTNGFILCKSAFLTGSVRDVIMNGNKDGDRLYSLEYLVGGVGVASSRYVKQFI